jgi:hypothetical protein
MEKVFKVLCVMLVAFVAVALIAAPTASISADPTAVAADESGLITSVHPGEYVVLNIAATNADKVELSAPDGTAFTLCPQSAGRNLRPCGQSFSAGVPVLPHQTTTYSVTAIGAGGTATASYTVTVK